MRYTCSRQRRLKAVKQAGALNGIEYVEVRHSEEPVDAMKQRTIYVRLLDPAPVDAADQVDGITVVIEGGERITGIDVDWIARGDHLPAGESALGDGFADLDHLLVVRTSARGDFSTYTLSLVAGPGSTAPPAGFDPLLVSVAFSFKVECPSDFDCGPSCSCPPASHAAPAIDYLAKDFVGFRRIMLERMALLAPEWTERNAADAGVAMVEMLAYVADELSYHQDAVATEAYLGTARSRVSLRRHARLVDYRVHDGCNARAWVHLEVDSPTVELPAHTTLLTQTGEEASLIPDQAAHQRAMAAGPVVFETVDHAVLHSDLSELAFYTWGELGCCLPRGATTATLAGKHPALRAGDVLVLAEKVSPTSGKQADADPTKRHPVRLTHVATSTDPSHTAIPDGSEFVTQITWDDADALPFPLCLNTDDGDIPVSVAWGNIVLADHGETRDGEALGVVPASRLAAVGSGAECGDDQRPAIPVRYRPRLARAPLTHRVASVPEPLFEVPLTGALQTALDGNSFTSPLPEVFTGHRIDLPSTGPQVRGTSPLWSVSDADSALAFSLRSAAGMLRVFAVDDPAVAALQERPRAALPALVATGTRDGVSNDWEPVADLLGSGRTARELTVETEHDGTAQLRFGDDVHGMRPVERTEFTATYRVGNGTAGNVGAGAIAHVVTTVGGITAVTNPLPAAGGVDLETTDEIRRDAPAAFKVQQRAVTPADYAEVTERNDRVQRAAATFRWTGSWHTVFVTADRYGGTPVDARFEADLREWLERYRMAGYDLEVDGPVFVPLRVGLHICVEPTYFRSDVAAEVRSVLSDRVLPDGRRGLFHPDNLSFGQSVYLSSILAAVHSVEGVQSVEVAAFERQHDPASSAIDTGELPMGRLEIARLDDDRNFPERGVLELTFGGGA